VAAVELVSPANKDRPEHCRDFVIKCASLLQERVALAVVDIVTERHADLHAHLLQLLGLSTPAGEPERVHLHASVYRTSRENGTWSLDVWPHPLAAGAPLPTFPCGWPWISPSPWSWKPPTKKPAARCASSERSPLRPMRGGGVDLPPVTTGSVPTPRPAVAS
jgi:hypothetical protein